MGTFCELEEGAGRWRRLQLCLDRGSGLLGLCFCKQRRSRRAECEALLGGARGERRDRESLLASRSRGADFRVLLTFFFRVVCRIAVLDGDVRPPNGFSITARPPPRPDSTRVCWRACTQRPTRALQPSRRHGLRRQPLRDLRYVTGKPRFSSTSKPRRQACPASRKHSMTRFGADSRERFVRHIRRHCFRRSLSAANLVCDWRTLQ